MEQAIEQNSRINGCNTRICGELGGSRSGGLTQQIASLAIGENPPIGSFKLLYPVNNYI